MRMNIEATPKTAFFAGIWSALGFSAFDVYERLNPLDVLIHNIMFLAVGVLFLFVPVLLFVLGSQYVRFGIQDVKYWSAFKALTLRGLCWFFGGAIGLIAFSVIENDFSI